MTLLDDFFLFAVPKEKYKASTTLLYFLRSSRISLGTKGCCYQGGCGVCVVSVAYVDSIKKKMKSFAVNSVSIDLCIICKYFK